MDSILEAAWFVSRLGHEHLERLEYSVCFPRSCVPAGNDDKT
jgi:hypothetical protein